MEKCFGSATEKPNRSMLQEQPEAKLRKSKNFHQATKALLMMMIIILIKCTF